ncbi:hypothetical protein CRUP_022135 [Coryphaenoides rupestris]|nr:hypothetical protein CRUP_022135 [Coryphaenoides rupestris]
MENCDASSKESVSERTATHRGPPRPRRSDNSALHRLFNNVRFRMLPSEERTTTTSCQAYTMIPPPPPPPPLSPSDGSTEDPPQTQDSAAGSSTTENTQDLPEEEEEPAQPPPPPSPPHLEPLGQARPPSPENQHYPHHRPHDPLPVQTTLAPPVAVEALCGGPVVSEPHTLPSSLVAPEPKLCGYLDKQGGPLRTWKHRWFTYEEKKSQLFYYRTPQDVTPLGCVALGSATFTYPLKGEDGSFHIQTPERTYILKAVNQETMMYWLQQLQAPAGYPNN